MYCKYCGNLIDEDSIHCKFCGKNNSDRKDELEVLNCPLCNNGFYIRKVSGIYNEVVSKSRFKGHGTSFIFPLNYRNSPSLAFTPINIEGEEASLLGQKLAPPKQPEKKKLRGCLITFLILVGIFFSIGIVTGMGVSIGSIETVYYSTMLKPIILNICLVILFILIWFLIIFFIKRKNKNFSKQYDEELKLYKKLYYKWNKFYYCFKHDIVFNPETGNYTSAEYMNE